MARAEESIQNSKLKIQERYIKDQTRAARYAESKINNAIAIQKAQDQKAAKAKVEEEDEARVKKEKADGKKLLEIRKSIAKQAADQEAKTNEEKLALKRERQLAELEGLAISAQEKQDAEKAINELYDAKKAELAEIKKLEDEEKAKVAEEKRLEKQLELDALELQRLLQDDQLKFDEREKLQIAYLEKKRLNDLKNDKLTEKEKEVINKKAEKAKEKVRDAEAKASKSLKDKVLNDALDGAAASFGIAQEVAVAKMLMAAPEAISGSFKEAAKAYAPPLSLAMGALGAAGTVAPIVKGLAEIKKNRFSKGGRSSGPAPSGSINTSAISAGASGVDVETISSLSANNAARLGIDPSIGGAAGSSAANNVMGGASGSVVFSESSYQSFQNQVNFREGLTTVGG